jgi:hypothetical protein
MRAIVAIGSRVRPVGAFAAFTVRADQAFGLLHQTLGLIVQASGAQVFRRDADVMDAAFQVTAFRPWTVRFAATFRAAAAQGC